MIIDFHELQRLAFNLIQPVKIETFCEIFCLQSHFFLTKFAVVKRNCKLYLNRFLYYPVQSFPANCFERWGDMMI